VIRPSLPIRFYVYCNIANMTQTTSCNVPDRLLIMTLQIYMDMYSAPRLGYICLLINTCGSPLLTLRTFSRCLLTNSCFHPQESYCNNTRSFAHIKRISSILHLNIQLGARSYEFAHKNSNWETRRRPTCCRSEGKIRRRSSFIPQKSGALRQQPR